MPPSKAKDKTPQQIEREQAEARRKAARAYVDADVDKRTYTGGAEAMHPFVDGLLVQAADLEDEKTGLLERIDANRQMLRNLVATGAASDEQREAVEGFYKTREKKDDDASSNGNQADAPAPAATPAS